MNKFDKKKYIQRIMKQKQSVNSLQNSFQAKPKQSYAPFGSVSSRGRKKKKGQQRKQIGPGAYDISLPIVQPIIQTFKKKNNNIIVKLAHIGTSSFQGEKDRFSNDILDKGEFRQKLGPGKYSPQKSFQYLQKSRVDKSAQLPQRKKAGLQLAKYIKHRERRTATFSQVKKIEIDDYVEMPALQSKQDQMKSDIKNKLAKIKGAAWSMMKQERLRKLKNEFTNLGPGKYYIDDFVKKQPLRKNRSISQEYSTFKSQSIRSFFDCIVFETKKDQKALLREANGYKSDSLGPGAYQIKQKEAKQNRFQFFGSTAQRI